MTDQRVPASDPAHPSHENVTTAYSPVPLATGAFHGTGGQLLLIWLTNAVLTVLTLGIYFAWGKARLYRFFYANTEFAGNRFRYVGNGKEIFIGSLISLAVLGALIGIAAVASLLAEATGQMAIKAVVYIVLYLGVIFLIQYATYATMRYRASRARYREIAFRLEGSPWAFARAAMPQLGLVIVTLGFGAPLFIHFRISRIYNNLWFGNIPFKWDAPRDEFWKLCIKGYFLSYITLGIYFFFWYPQVFAFVRSHLTLGGNRFQGNVLPGEFFKLTITNALLAIFTLGIAVPWIFVRTMRFYLERMALENPQALEAALQGERKRASSVGEAMADAMDVGVSLGF